jgi:cytochrome c-type biogenesis protein CcmE
MNLSPHKKGERKIFPIIIVGLVFGIAILIVGSSASTVGTATPDAEKIFNSPQKFLGRAVQLEGTIAEGSVRTDKDQFDIYFDLMFPGEETRRITVHYTKTLPDPFKIGRVAVAEGVLNRSSCQSDGRCSGTLGPCKTTKDCAGALWIEGSKLTVKCPSKYQEEQGQDTLDDEKIKKYRKENPEHFE